MQLDEATERAFKAGAEWATENAYCAVGNTVDGVIMDADINEGYMEYINGNNKSNEGAQILDKSPS